MYIFHYNLCLKIKYNRFIFGVLQIQNISTGKPGVCSCVLTKKQQPQICFQHPVQCKLNKE